MPTAAVYPLEKLKADSVPLNRARSSSKAVWGAMVPHTRREAPDPAPQRFTASLKAAVMDGWLASPK